MPASHETHDPGPVGAPRGAPVLVAIVAGTKTRIKVLEKLLNQPGIIVCGGAQEPVAAEELVVGSPPRCSSARSRPLVRWPRGHRADHGQPGHSDRGDRTGRRAPGGGHRRRRRRRRRCARRRPRVGRVRTHGDAPPQDRQPGPGDHPPARTTARTRRARRRASQTPAPPPERVRGVGRKAVEPQRRRPRHELSQREARRTRRNESVGRSRSGPDRCRAARDRSSSRSVPRPAGRRRSPRSSPSCRPTCRPPSWWFSTWRRDSSRDWLAGWTASAPCPSSSRSRASACSPARSTSRRPTRTWSCDPGFRVGLDRPAAWPVPRARRRRDLPLRRPGVRPVRGRGPAHRDGT